MTQKIWQLLEADPSLWCQGGTGSKGDARCTALWMVQHYGDEGLGRLRMKFIETNNIQLSQTCLADWNDAPERTVQDVIQAFGKADL